MKRCLGLFLLLGALLDPAAGGEAKIVSLSPAVTEIVCRLGAQKQLVGRSSACDYPAEIKALPALGGFGNPALEPIAAAGATLVLTDVFRDAGAKQSLERLGLTVLLTPLRSLADYERAVEEIGRAVGREAAAEAEVRRVREIFAAARRRQKERKGPAPGVLLMVWHDPVTAAGRTSYLTELIELAGGRNVGEAVKQDYFRASFEWILMAAPELIVYPAGMGSNRAFTPPPAWAELPALRQGKFFRPEKPELYFRLGPRVTEALAELTEMVGRGE